ncbi:WLM-domain-containing protein [Neolentinus lepideus HHB14362 ss-1]|uniref:WLM-domain-containing protein n=1 Tax=Neolentinus lepideus HHB14362 ss-1 TaxID=1314782 RepID=A0A165QF99_9AGAM|nr:WLM-domain-containing protein [Neolentinus lepideus HHB14362 ss-1]
MVHHRINEREPNPNPHVNFITALPMPEPDAQEEARQLLRALAAQVRPIMKAHGFVVNSFEEYEYNQVFAGRNWEAGEIVELVLRRPDGRFYPNSWLLSTLCHELAHIKHMNHGPAFQALWRQLNREVHSLQVKGYYGDGYWSSGQRLLDSASVGGQTITTEDLPEYMCGGAQNRARPARRRRRRPTAAGPSNHTGAQTAKRRKAGSRVAAQGVFKGKGAALNEDIGDEEDKKVGTGFRKKAARHIYYRSHFSKRAREERALAAERRLQALQGPSHPKEESHSSDGEDDDELEIKEETDQERRKAMLDTMKESELEGLKTSAAGFFKDFFLSAPPKPRTEQEKDPLDLIDLTSDNELEPSSSRVRPASPKTGASARKPPSRPSTSHATPPKRQSLLDDFSSTDPPKSRRMREDKVGHTGPRSLVLDEVNLRKKELLGLALGGARNKLGVSPSDTHWHHHHSVSNSVQGEQEWACNVCTL